MRLAGRWLRRFVLALVLLLAVPALADDAQALFRQHRSHVWVELGGRVARLLPDDRQGARHQRFIVQTESGVTLLVAHNIDLAQRVPVRVGDAVKLRGEYIWNRQGGILHWTHRDPQQRHPGGWIETPQGRVE